MKNLSIFLAAFAIFGIVASQNYPIEDPFKDMINDLLSRIEDPLVVNDKVREWSGVNIKTETRDIAIVGLSSLHVITSNIDLIGRFETKIGAPGLITTAGGINFYLESNMVWPTPIFGDGQIYGEISGIEIIISGQFMVYPRPIHFKNFDYNFTIISTTIAMEGINDEVALEHVNQNGPQILQDIDWANHVILQRFFEDAINKFFENTSIFDIEKLANINPANDTCKDALYPPITSFYCIPCQQYCMENCGTGGACYNWWIWMMCDCYGNDEL